MNWKTPIIFFLLSGCYFVEHFEDTEKKDQQGALQLSADTVLGQSLGQKAGAINEDALAEVHTVTSSYPPASIRPDPDLYARQLLLHFRDEGSTVARLMGEIEEFRPLLGGASEDFQKAPQTEFDATSLLATLSVSNTICIGLINPNSWQHPGWSSILPSSPNEWDENIRFLLKEIAGRSTDQISDDIVSELKTILDSEHAALVEENENLTSESYINESYVPLCSLLTLDPETQNL